MYIIVFIELTVLNAKFVMYWVYTPFKSAKIHSPYNIGVYMACWLISNQERQVTSQLCIVYNSFILLMFNSYIYYLCNKTYVA